MSDELTPHIERLVRVAPPHWLEAACEVFMRLPLATTQGVALQQIPPTNNADLSRLLGEVTTVAARSMSWEALAWTLKTAQTLYKNWQAQQEIELLWGGPTPAIQIPARRIDQALYDLIAESKHEIVLVTFAAAKIERLTTALLNAAARGVSIYLVLEFEQSSEGQLSFDALRAFPPALVATVTVYHWPAKNRERNQSGRPGKLHAKLAIIDDTVLVSSANLTDDAFSRNLEIGVLVRSSSFLASTKTYIDSLRMEGVLVRL